MSAALVPAMIPQQLSVPTAETEEPASEGEVRTMRQAAATRSIIMNQCGMRFPAQRCSLLERCAARAPLP